MNNPKIEIQLALRLADSPDYVIIKREELEGMKKQERIDGIPWAFTKDHEIYNRAINDVLKLTTTDLGGKLRSGEFEEDLESRTIDGAKTSVHYSEAQLRKAVAKQREELAPQAVGVRELEHIADIEIMGQKFIVRRENHEAFKAVVDGFTDRIKEVEGE